MPRGVLRLGGMPLARVRGVPTVAIGPGVSIRLHRPTGAQNTGTAMLWIHGGGYVLGSAGQDDIYCRDLADATGITVAAVNYRLAPQFSYPTPLEDCYTALAWLAEQPWVDSNRIAIGGASAGGGLTAALALLARDRGEAVPDEDAHAGGDAGARRTRRAHRRTPRPSAGPDRRSS